MLGWLVQDAPDELAACECCSEPNCTNERYECCDIRKAIQAQIQAEREAEAAELPKSTTRVVASAVEAARRSGSDR
jgi:hypothetical protein